jgi:hypothetical protein
VAINVDFHHGGYFDEKDAEDNWKGNSATNQKHKRLICYVKNLKHVTVTNIKLKAPLDAFDLLSTV